MSEATTKTCSACGGSGGVRDGDGYADCIDCLGSGVVTTGVYLETLPSTREPSCALCGDTGTVHFQGGDENCAVCHARLVLDTDSPLASPDPTPPFPDRYIKPALGLGATGVPMDEPVFEVSLTNLLTLVEDANCGSHRAVAQLADQGAAYTSFLLSEVGCRDATIAALRIERDDLLARVEGQQSEIDGFARVYLDHRRVVPGGDCLNADALRSEYADGAGDGGSRTNAARTVHAADQGGAQCEEQG